MLPIVKSETLQVIHETQDYTIKHWKDTLETLKEENELLFEYVSGMVMGEHASEDAFLASHAFVHGMLGMYRLLKIQDEADDMERVWGNDER